MTHHLNLTPPVNPDCPRIAHESGVVLGCQVEHVGVGAGLHGTVTGVMWTDDDDRIAHAALDPHHRVARFRAASERKGVPDTPAEGRSGATGPLRALSRGSGAESRMPIPAVRGGRRAENGAGAVAEDPRSATGALRATDGGGS